jgi:hypothetical protein
MGKFLLGVTRLHSLRSAPQERSAEMLVSVGLQATPEASTDGCSRIARPGSLPLASQTSRKVQKPARPARFALLPAGRTHHFVALRRSGAWRCWHRCGFRPRQMPVQPLEGFINSINSQRLPAGKTAGSASLLASAPTAKRGSAQNTCGVSASAFPLLRFAGAPEGHRTTQLRSLAPGLAHTPLGAHPLKPGRCRWGCEPMKGHARTDAGRSDPRRRGTEILTVTTRKVGTVMDFQPFARLLRPPPAPRQTTPQTPQPRQGVFTWRGDSGGSGLRAWQLHAGLGGKTTRPPAFAGARSFLAAKKRVHKFPFFCSHSKKGK